MLKIQISSFSFIYGEIPSDNSGNGGGFVFDCRALPNPGRYDEYKNLTGKDAAVIKYLQKEEEVNEFLQYVYSLADLSVKKYIKRGFTHLMFSFGCTGGQHRSVYAAEQLTKYITEHYSNVEVEMHHIAREEADKNKKQ